MSSMRSRHGGAQGLIAVIATICILIAAYFIFKQSKTAREGPVGDAYYHCEDCGYEFVGSSTLAPPIKCPKTGSLTAVRAVKFKGRDGKAFTGYYEKYDLETKKLIEAKKRGEKVDDAKIGNLLVQEPDGDWVDSTTEDGIIIFNTVTSPSDDSTGQDLERVYPQSEKKK